MHCGEVQWGWGIDVLHLLFSPTRTSDTGFGGRRTEWPVWMRRGGGVLGTPEKAPEELCLLKFSKARRVRVVHCQEPAGRGGVSGSRIAI